MDSISIQIKIIRNISRICQVLEMKSIAFLAIVHTRWIQNLLFSGVVDLTVCLTLRCYTYTESRLGDSHRAYLVR